MPGAGCWPSATSSLFAEVRHVVLVGLIAQAWRLRPERAYQGGRHWGPRNSRAGCGSSHRLLAALGRGVSLLLPLLDHALRGLHGVAVGQGEQLSLEARVGMRDGVPELRDAAEARSELPAMRGMLSQPVLGLGDRGPPLQASDLADERQQPLEPVQLAAWPPPRLRLPVVDDVDADLPCEPPPLLLDLQGSVDRLEDGFQPRAVDWPRALRAMLAPRPGRPPRPLLPSLPF